MNPYGPYLHGIPGLIAVFAAFPKRRMARLVLLSVAAGIYWLILPRFVDWAYTHPFNASDGGPRAFVAMFGWLIGLVTLILPIYLAIRFSMWSLKKVRNRKQHNHTPEPIVAKRAKGSV